MWTADRLREELELQVSQGVSAAEVVDFERRSGFQFPPELRWLYTACNGAKHPHGDLSLWSFTEAENTLRRFSTDSIWREFGLIGLADLNDSNPYCVCCRGSLYGLIIHVQHDGRTDVAYRSIDEIFSAIAQGLREPKRRLYDLMSSFDGPLRTPTDIQLGRELLGKAELFDGDLRDYTCRFAVTLLSECEIEEITALLDDGSDYVRTDVLQRLRQFGSPRAMAVIDSHKQEFARFVKHCSTILEVAGFGCKTHDENAIRITGIPESLRVEEGMPIELCTQMLTTFPFWLNSELLFSKRKNDCFDAWLIGRVTELARNHIWTG